MPPLNKMPVAGSVDVTTGVQRNNVSFCCAYQPDCLVQYTINKIRFYIKSVFFLMSRGSGRVAGKISYSSDTDSGWR